MMSGFQSKRFVDLPQSVEKHLICSICLDIYNNAVKSKCEHTFCKSCLQNWIESNHKNCPECRLEFIGRKRSNNSRSDRNLVIVSNFVFINNMKINEIINELKIKCDFESNGCQEVIELGLLSDHLKNCEHRFCKTCGLTIERDVEHNCLELLKTDRNRLKAKLNEIESKKSLLEKEIENNVWYQKFNEMETKNLELKQQLNKKTNELDNKLVVIKKLNDTNKKLEKEFNNIITEKNQLKTKVNEITDKNQEKIKTKEKENQKKLNEIKAKNSLLEEKIKTKETENQKKLNEIKAKNSLLEEKIKTKETENQKKLNEIKAKNPLFVETIKNDERKSLEVMSQHLKKTLDNNLKLISKNKLNEELIFRLKNQFKDIGLNPLNVYFGTQYTNPYEISLSYYGFDFKSFFIKFESIEELRFCSDDSNPNLIVIKLRTNSQMCTTIQNSIQLSEASRGWFDVTSEDPNERYIVINISNPTLELKLFMRVSLIFYLYQIKPDLICIYESIDLNEANRQTIK